MGFSLNLVLVVVAGAELFTGNNLIVMCVVSGRVPLHRLLRNWGVVYAGNFVGALSIAVMTWLGGWWSQSDSAFGKTALAITASIWWCRPRISPRRASCCGCSRHRSPRSRWRQEVRPGTGRGRTRWREGSRWSPTCSTPSLRRWIALKILRPLFAFQWYLEPDPLVHGLNLAGVGVLLAITAAGVGAALLMFERRDLAA